MKKKKIKNCKKNAIKFLIFLKKQIASKYEYVQTFCTFEGGACKGEQTWTRCGFIATPS